MVPVLKLNWTVSTFGLFFKLFWIVVAFSIVPKSLFITFIFTQYLSDFVVVVSSSQNTRTWPIWGTGLISWFDIIDLLFNGLRLCISFLMYLYVFLSKLDN